MLFLRDYTALDYVCCYGRPPADRLYLFLLPLDEAKMLPVSADFHTFILEVCASNLGHGVCYPDWVSWFLGVFAKFRKANIRLVMSVRPSVCLSVRPSVRLSVRPHATTRLR